MASSDGSSDESSHGSNSDIRTRRIREYDSPPPIKVTFKKSAKMPKSKQQAMLDSYAKGKFMQSRRQPRQQANKTSKQTQQTQATQATQLTQQTQPKHNQQNKEISIESMNDKGISFFFCNFLLQMRNAFVAFVCVFLFLYGIRFCDCVFLKNRNIVRKFE